MWFSFGLEKNEREVDCGEFVVSEELEIFLLDGIGHWMVEQRHFPVNF